MLTSCSMITKYKETKITYAGKIICKANNSEYVSVVCIGTGTATQRSVPGQKLMGTASS